MIPLPAARYSECRELDPRRTCCPDCGAEVLRVYMRYRRTILVDHPEIPGDEHGRHDVRGLFVAVSADGEARPARLPRAPRSGDAVHSLHELTCPYVGQHEDWEGPGLSRLDADDGALTDDEGAHDR